jgi:hypothetical protein
MNSKPLIITPDIVKGFIGGYNLVPPIYRYRAIEDKAAEILAESEVPLDLDAVKEITPTAIRYLARRGDELCLNGLTGLTDDQAEALASHRGSLSLNGLTDVSLSSLEHLVSTPRKLLSLDGLKMRARFFGQAECEYAKATLIPEKRDDMPKPRRRNSVRKKYFALAGNHKDHPGTGKGPGQCFLSNCDVGWDKCGGRGEMIWLGAFSWLNQLQDSTIAQIREKNYRRNDFVSNRQ